MTPEQFDNIILRLKQIDAQNQVIIRKVNELELQINASREHLNARQTKLSYQFRSLLAIVGKRDKRYLDALKKIIPLLVDSPDIDPRVVKDFLFNKNNPR